MFNPDDVGRLFAREVTLADDLKRRDSDPTLGLPNLLAETTTLARYPSSAPCYYACRPVTLMGAEVEGGAGVVSAATGTFFALNLGTAVPPPGTQVLAARVDNRWVFRYDA